MDPTDFSPEFNAKMHELYVNGVTPDQVRSHFADSKNPEHQRWIEQMDRASALEDQDVTSMPSENVPTEYKRDLTTPLIDMGERTAEQAKTATNDMSLGEKLGYGAGAALLAGSAGAIGNRLLSRVLPTPTERATALQAKTYARATELEAERANKANGISPFEQAKVSEIEAKIARENAAHQLELEQKKELHQAKLAKLAKINEKLMKGETIGPEGITPAEPTKGLAELENATGGPLNSKTDIKLAKIYQAQNAPSAPPAQASANPAPPPAPPSAPPQAPNPPQNPVKVAEAATPPSTLQGGAPVAPNGDVTVDENALKEAALNPSEKANNPELATNVQAETDLQNKQVQDAILQQNQAAQATQTAPTESIPKPNSVSEIPEGRIFNYMTGKKDKNGKIIEYNNKQGKDVIGKGGWNWYQGQMGPEAEINWLHQFGRTNQTYRDVTQAIKEGRLVGAQVNEKGQGGKFPREPHVPNYIKGNVDIGMMAGILATGGIGALTAYMAQKHPDFATQYQKALEASGESTGTEGMLKSNKAEELSPAMRNIIIKSGNQSYRAELNKQIRKEKNAARIMELEREKDRTR